MHNSEVVSNKLEWKVDILIYDRELKRFEFLLPWHEIVFHKKTTHVDFVDEQIASVRDSGNDPCFIRRESRMYINLPVTIKMYIVYLGKLRRLHRCRFHPVYERYVPWNRCSCIAANMRGTLAYVPNPPCCTLSSVTTPRTIHVSTQTPCEGCARDG